MAIGWELEEMKGGNCVVKEGKYILKNNNMLYNFSKKEVAVGKLSSFYSISL